jgi:hypothetical protein
VFTQTLVEFLFRLTLGVAAAMGLTDSRQVTSGFFRVHLWVLLGVQTLATLAVYSSRSTAEGSSSPIWVGQLFAAIAGAIVSYLGATIWMYEAKMAGKAAVWLVAALGLAGCTLPILLGNVAHPALQIVDRITGGALLGFVTTAMLLGHWYLNTPTMKLQPLWRLIHVLAAVILARALVSAIGVFGHVGSVGPDAVSTSWWLFYLLRLLPGLGGLMVLVIMTARTLKIPNTQSATGILYAAVILAFIGELASQLLSAEASYPI